MLKKCIFLATVLMAVGLSVVQAQDAAKLQQLQTELEQIEARANARGGTFTPQEVQRMNEIQQEIIQAMGAFGGMAVPAQPKQTNQWEQQAQQAQQREQQQQQQREQQARADYIKEHTGANRNWPPASVTNTYKFTIKQPTGTTASYTVNRGVVYIYLQNANANAFQNIKQQIETTTNKKMESFGRNSWIARISTSQNAGFVYTIEQEYDVITIQLNQFDNSKG